MWCNVMMVQKHRTRASSTGIGHAEIGDEDVPEGNTEICAFDVAAFSMSPGQTQVHKQGRRPERRKP